MAMAVQAIGASGGFVTADIWSVVGAIAVIFFGGAIIRLIIAALAKGGRRVAGVDFGQGKVSFEPAGPAEGILLHGKLHEGIAGAGAVAHLVVLDVTEGGEPEPVLCLAPEAFLFDGPAMCRAIPFDLPYANVELNGFPVGVLPPVEAMLCPRRGTRRIQILVGVEQCGLQLISAKVERTIEQSTWGYQQMDMARKTSAVRLATLGVLVAGVDGVVDRTEAFAAREFLQELLKANEASTDVKSAVNEALKSSLVSVRTCGDVPARVRTVCGEIVSEGAASDPEVAFELALRVISADGRLDEAEASIMDQLASWLQLEASSVESLKDRCLHLSQLQCDSEEQMVGIDPDWSEDRKLKHIRSEHRKWQGRVTLQDPAKRQEAEQRLKILARLRAKLDAQRAA